MSEIQKDNHPAFGPADTGDKIAVYSFKNSWGRLDITCCNTGYLDDFINQQAAE